MGALSYWTLVVVLYQTCICILISYVTLTCQLRPERNELHELTLMKLLYLYDPDACSRIYFYNYTEIMYSRQIYSNIVWPMKNQIASSFRGKLKLWLSLHIVWSLFAFGNMTLVDQPCKFYIALVPFTVTGIVILVVDIVFMTVFVADAKFTKTEADLLMYISDIEAVNITILDKRFLGLPPTADISWIALIMAYASCRAIVQWVINFWIIKDNFLEGLAVYRRFHTKRRSRFPA